MAFSLVMNRMFCKDGLCLKFGRECVLENDLLLGGCSDKEDDE